MGYPAEKRKLVGFIAKEKLNNHEFLLRETRTRPGRLKRHGTSKRIVTHVRR